MLARYLGGQARRKPRSGLRRRCSLFRANQAGGGRVRRFAFLPALVLTLLAASVALGVLIPERVLAATVVNNIVFPLEKKVSWTDTFGASRSGGRSHEGNDIMCPKMTPLLAVTSGTLDGNFMNFSGTKLSSYNGLPYYNIMLRGDDGNDYFYIHCNNDTPGTDDGKGGPQNAYAPGLKAGSRVKKGQLLGWAGDSGNAEDSGSHLHFEIHLGGYKNPVNPYASLKAAPTYSEWVAGGGASTTTTNPPTTSTTKPATTSTTNPPTTSTTRGPGGQIDPGRPKFDDVAENDWYYADLAALYAEGIVQGTDDGNFRPYQTMTRAHLAAFLVRAFAPGGLSDPPAEQVFSDVPKSYWGFDEIGVAAQAGLVKGVGDGTMFAPDAMVTRAQMVTMICRALDLLGPDDEAKLAAGTPPPFTDVPAGYWALAAITVSKECGLVEGCADGCFRPEDGTQRCQAVAVISRSLRYEEQASGREAGS